MVMSPPPMLNDRLPHIPLKTALRVYGMLEYLHSCHLIYHLTVFATVQASLPERPVR